MSPISGHGWKHIHLSGDTRPSKPSDLHVLDQLIILRLLLDNHLRDLTRDMYQIEFDEGATKGTSSLNRKPRITFSHPRFASLYQKLEKLQNNICAS